LVGRPHGKGAQHQGRSHQHGPKSMAQPK
jgi:hypothetical protein